MVSQVFNEIQLSYKTHSSRSSMVKITGAETAYKIMHSLWDENRIELVEDFKMLLLNRANKVIGLYNVSSGGTAGTVVDTKLIFVAALKANASNIILAHNHPSGNMMPSDADKRMTARIIDAGKLLDINVYDHIILTNDGYYSFTEGSAFEKIHRGDNVYYERMMPF